MGFRSSEWYPVSITSMTLPSLSVTSIGGGSVGQASKQKPLNRHKFSSYLQ